VIKPNGKLLRDDNGKIILKDGNKQYVDFTVYDDKSADGKQISDRLFYLSFTETISTKEANYKELTKHVNAVFSKYEINTCIRKIHFLAQVYHETQRLGCTYESDESAAISGEDFYRGRGFIHVTSESNYKKFYVHLFKKDSESNQLTAFAPKVAKQLEYAVKSAAWYWTDADQSIKNINEYADADDIEKVSAAVNHPSVLRDKKLDTNKINGFSKRKEYYESLKLIMNYETCKNKK
jgi:predicted chitinase